MVSNNDQVSTKDFLKSVFKYFHFLGSNWQILLIAFLIGTLIDTSKNNFSKSSKKYGGMIEFNIDLEGNNNPVGGLAGALGIQQMASSQGLTDITNFTKVITSETVFKRALMTEVELFNVKDLFINFYVDSSGIKEDEWGKKFYRGPLPFGDYIFTEKEIQDFTPYENVIIRSIIEKIEEETLLSKDAESSIYILQSVMINEMLTKTWLEVLLNATEEFYTEINTLKTRKLIAIQEKRTDSLSVLLRGVDRGIASRSFEQLETVDPYAAANISRLNRDNTYLSNLYLTNLNSLESLRNLLVEQTKIFHILTPVTLPLEMSVKSGISIWLTAWILLVGTVFIISVIKTYNDIMKEESEE